MGIGAENQQAEKEKRNQGNRRAVCRGRWKGATANGYRRRKTAGVEKTELGKPKGCLPLSRERRDGRMNIGAEKQQVEKEKTGSGKPKGCLPLSRERHDGRMDTGAKM